MGQLLRSKVQRSADLLARYGGEEFALLPGLDAAFAESLRLLLEQAAVADRATQLAVMTMSAGVASMVAVAESSPEQLLAAADAALYRAKATGRNRVAVAPDLGAGEADEAAPG